MHNKLDIHLTIADMLVSYEGGFSGNLSEAIHFLQGYKQHFWAITSYQAICNIDREIANNKLQTLLSPVSWIRSWESSKEVTTERLLQAVRMERSQKHNKKLYKTTLLGGR